MGVKADLFSIANITSTEYNVVVDSITKRIAQAYFDNEEVRIYSVLVDKDSPYSRVMFPHKVRAIENGTVTFSLLPDIQFIDAVPLDVTDAITENTTIEEFYCARVGNEIILAFDETINDGNSYNAIIKVVEIKDTHEDLSPAMDDELVNMYIALLTGDKDFSFRSLQRLSKEKANILSQMNKRKPRYIQQSVDTNPDFLWAD